VKSRLLFTQKDERVRNKKNLQITAFISKVNFEANKNYANSFEKSAIFPEDSSKNHKINLTVIPD